MLDADRQPHEIRRARGARPLDTGPVLREAGYETELPDEALLVPQAPAGAELETVEAAR